MISELEQCSCGIIFQVPMLLQSSFTQHMMNGTHNRARSILTCGPCFFGVHGDCEHRRADTWRCRCNHKSPAHAVSGQRAEELSFVWSNWLMAGRPSELNMSA